MPILLEPAELVRQDAIFLAFRRGMPYQHVVDCSSECVAAWWQRSGYLTVGPQRSDGSFPRRWDAAPFVITREIHRDIAIDVRTYERRFRVGMYYEGISLDALLSGFPHSNAEPRTEDCVHLEPRAPCRTPEDLVVDRAAHLELRGIVRSVLDRQPLATKVCFVRFHLHGECSATIALDIGQSVESVRQRAYRCRVAILQELERQGWSRCD